MGSRRGLRVTVVRLMAAIAVVGVVLGALKLASRHVEWLESPVAVRSWSESGLHLADSRTVQLPGFAALPLSSSALAETTKRGVEIGKDGRVYGLVRVHHWCGNDRTGEHIVRVDLSHLLLYVGEGQSLVHVARPPWSMSASQAFSQAGWRIETFNGFDSWRTTGAPNLALQGLVAQQNDKPLAGSADGMAGEAASR